MINTRKDREVLVVNLQFERLDASTSMFFRSRLVEIVNDGNKLIILNLENLKFVDSSGLGSIISILKTLGQEGELFLCGIDEKIMSMFRLTRMDRVFKIFKTETEAIKDIS